MQENEPTSCNPNEDLITPKTCARKLKVTERTLDNWRRSGKIPAISIGRSIRYLWSDVLAAVKAPSSTPSSEQNG